jgi:hypothetical protein
MKLAFFVFAFILPLNTYAAPIRSIICTDTEFGAGHLKLIIADASGFFAPRDQKPSVLGDFWVKGEKYVGVLESPIFMPDWGDAAGWYRASPSILDISLCSWGKCPVRKVKMIVHTKDQMKGEGSIKFLLKTASDKKETFDRKVNCEIK